MKRILNLSIFSFVVLAAFVNCGKSGNNNGNNNTQANADQITARCQGNQQCIEAEMQRMYGPNSQGYYQGTQNFGGQQWQQYQVPHYQYNNNYAPYGQQNFYANPQHSFYGSVYY